MADLHHHGDVEVGELVDFAVNTYAGPRPPWLEDALRDSLAGIDRYPDPTAAQQAIARHHGRPDAEVLATAGAAEAFGLIARAVPWRRPVVVHPQFTEPHAALEQAGCTVTEAVLPAPFTLAADSIPADADLVVIGNPTNPTGVLHPAPAIRSLLRPGRLVVVDEAFMDCVPGETESLAADRSPGLVVVRSLTKHWSIPGIRAGYLLGDPGTVGDLRRGQVPWSVSTPAAAAMIACTSSEADADARHRAREIATWRTHLTDGLTELGIDHLPSAASYVLARPGDGVHALLRKHGIACRRADTFPGLDGSWLRIAVRPPHLSDHLLAVLTTLTACRDDPRATPRRRKEVP